MTFTEKYNYLFTDLEVFGRFYPAKFNTTVSIEDLRDYAKSNLSSNIPIIAGNAKNMLRDLNRCNNINEPLI